MNNIHDFHQVKTTAELPLVIGFFDGLHKGH
jgi:FAD synthase